MYYRDGEQVIGVLNDWDLATVVSTSTAPSTDRTGTVPFIAIRLLEGRDREHRFRHDAESAIWAFVWVCACSNGEKEKVPEAYSPWRFSTMATSASWRKGHFFGSALIETVEVHEYHQANRLLCVFLLALLNGLIPDWSKPADAKTEARDMDMFRVLVSRVRAFQSKLEEISKLGTSDRKVLEEAQVFIEMHYPKETPIGFWNLQ